MNTTLKFFRPRRTSLGLIISLLVFLVLIMPVLSFAAGLVPCDGTPANPCGFNQFIALINNVIKYILLLVIPICAIMFAYAGFLLVTSGGEASARTKAKSIFTNALIGLVIAFAAWLIIKLILTILGYKYTKMFFK